MLDSINQDTVWLYVLTEAALSLSPGLRWFWWSRTAWVMARAGRCTQRRGILPANAICFALSSTALGMVLASSPVFFGVV